MILKINEIYQIYHLLSNPSVFEVSDFQMSLYELEPMEFDVAKLGLTSNLTWAN